MTPRKMSKAKELIVALGSNFRQRQNMEYAKSHLASVFNGGATFSKEMWTSPIGVKSDLYLNCLCVGATKHSYQQTLTALKRIERKCGRTVKNDKLHHIMMDLDILSYDGERHHTEDWSRDYITELMEDANMRIAENETNGKEPLTDKDNEDENL